MNTNESKGKLNNLMGRERRGEMNVDSEISCNTFDTSIRINLIKTSASNL